MADVKPFRGVRYNLKRVGDASGVIAPPYDIINEDLQTRLHDRSAVNVVRLILADEERLCRGADNRYDSARLHFNNWLKCGILAQDAEPAIYLLAQDFDFHGQKHTRWGFFASVKLEELDSGVVIPHESTMEGPKADRLKLMESCRANLSPIFSCYFDADKSIGKLLAGVGDSPPDLVAENGDGVVHRMWKVDDQSRLDELGEAMKSVSLFIADGHHRYESALAYRDIARKERPGDSGPWERTMMYLTDFEDPGLLVLPFHRAIKRLNGLSSDEFLARLERSFDVEEIDINVCNVPECDGDSVIEMLAERGSEGAAFGLVLKDRPSPYMLTRRKNASRLLDDIPAPIRELDVMIIHRLALVEVLGIGDSDLREGKAILYDPDWKVIFDKVFNESWAGAFLLNRPQIKQIGKVSKVGLKMPQKSTFFYPKAPSGLVIHRLE